MYASPLANLESQRFLLGKEVEHFVPLYLGMILMSLFRWTNISIYLFRLFSSTKAYKKHS